MNPLALWIFAGIVAIDAALWLALFIWTDSDLLDGPHNTKAED